MSDRRITTRVFLCGETPIEISLEVCFWEALGDSARRRRMTTGKLISTVLEVHGSQSSSASAVLRVFLISDAMDPTTSLTRKTTNWRPRDVDNHGFSQFGSLHRL